MYSSHLRNQIVNISGPRYDDNQYFDSYTEILLLTPKYKTVTYVANDTGNRYIWDGVILKLLINGSGAVNSVTAGDNINLTGTTNDPIINVVNINHELISNIGINSHSAIDAHISSSSNPHNVSKNQLSLGNVENLKVNLTAIVAPNGTNDLSQGYSLGSRWFDTVTKKEYVGVDFSVLGSAVWKETTQGGATTLAGLTDVDIVTISPVNGDSIIYNGTKFVAGSTTSEQNLTTNLLLNCSFNVNANDNSTYASAGSLNGTVTQIVGILGNAYNFFSGTGQHYINYGVQSRLNFQINNSWTVACWIRTNVGGSIERILCSNSEGLNGSGWSITLANPSLGRFEIQLKDNITTRGLVARYDLGAIVTDNAWHYVVCVHRGVNGWTGSSIDLYFDGINQIVNKTIPTNSLLSTDSIIAGPTIPFNIASRNSGEGNSWIGDIDQFSIFNFSLIASQISSSTNTSLYNNGTGKETFEVTTISQHDHPISDIRLLQPALDTKLENVASSNIFLTSISGIGATRTVNSQIGSEQPLVLELVSPANNGSQISANATLTASTSQLGIGYLPVNRGVGSEYVKHQYDYLRKHLPCYLRMVNTVDTNSYVSFTVNSYAGAGGFNYFFNVTQIPTDSTLVSFVSTTKFHIIFEPIINPVGLSGQTLNYNGSNVLTANSTLTNDGSRVSVNNASVLFTGTTGTLPPSGAGTRLVWHPAKGAIRAGIVNGSQFDDGSIATASVAFGENNISSGPYSVCVGGFGNLSSATNSFIGGGAGNQATNGGSVCVAGNGNISAGVNSCVVSGVSNNAGGVESFIGGGRSNSALGQGGFIGGGLSNVIISGATNSVAIGAFSQVNHSNSFIFADGNTTTSTNNNTFGARASNGFRFYSTAGTSTGAEILANGNSWSTISDITKKENFQEIDLNAHLDKIALMRAETWNYIEQDVNFRHYGPYAQEFHQAFGEDGVGCCGCDTSIASADMDGVLFTAVKALILRLKALETEVNLLKNP
jgi:hypothetical protein